MTRSTEPLAVTLPSRTRLARGGPAALAGVVLVCACAVAPLGAAALTAADLRPEGGATPGVTVEVTREPGPLPALYITVLVEPEAVRLTAGGSGIVASLAGGDVAAPAGLPAVPGLTLRVALPEGMRATAVRVLASRDTLLATGVRLAPAQPPRPIGSGYPSAPAPRNPAAYAAPAPFPAETVLLTGEADLAGQAFAVLRVHPLRYAAATGDLTLARLLVLAVDGEWGRMCSDLLPASASERARGQAEAALRGLVVNPDHVRVHPAPAPGRALEPGTYDYVIVTQSAWVSLFEPLRVWRTRLGIPARTVTTEWILTGAGYPGTSAKKIRAFVADARETWGTTDFLLGGDTNVVTCHSDTVSVPGYGFHNIPNDTYYADYDEDFVCEVNVGRASARTVTQVETFVRKALTYERTPPLAGWATTAAFSGFDNATPGDGYGEICQEAVRAAHLPAHWTLDTEYDDEPGSHRADVLLQFASGAHLINHHDHCTTSELCVGWVCHNQTVTSSDMWDLMNGERLSLCLAIGCYPCEFTATTCIGEMYVRNPIGGGFAFIGNTAMGWGGNFEDVDAFSVRQNRYFFRNLFDDGITRLGENFTDAKNDEYDPVDPYNLHRYCFRQLSLLGDPAAPLWTSDPAALAATHPETVFSRVAKEFTVTVAGAGLPDEGATVCVWKGDEIYEVTRSVAGSATFSLEPASVGTLLVTVWAKDHLPYEASVPVRRAPTPVETQPCDVPREFALSVAPNPFRGSADIVLAVPAHAGRITVRLYNARGELVRTLVDAFLRPGRRVLAWDGRTDSGATAASGVYLCDARCEGERRLAKLALTR
jgi:hypothetical protein